MPNWCFNSISVEGAPEDIQEFDAQFKKKHESYSGGTTTMMKAQLDSSDTKKMLQDYVDFRIVDNNGSLTVHHIDSVEEKEGYSFSNIVPLTKEHYLNGWYDWSIDNWGTKWDLSETNVEFDVGGAGISYSFETAWGPPEPAVAAMSRLFPNLRFEHTYEEGGMQFAGIVEYEHGMEVSRRETDDKDPDSYHKFLRDEFGNDEIEECTHCKRLYDKFSVDEDEDGNETCPNCEEALVK